MTFGPLVFKKDTRKNKPINCFGKLSVDGDLTLPSGTVKGPVNVKGTFKITKDDFEVFGPVKIKGDLICDEDFEVYGSLHVKGKIVTEDLEVYGPLTAKSIHAEEEVIVFGSVKVKENIISDREIILEIANSRGLKVGGIIKAPLVKISAREKIIEAEIFKKLSRKHYDEKIVISNVHIIADKLVLEGVELKGKVKAKEIVYE
ncbi:MAG: polymer-forming cytoskeletal protein [Candidatus Heimdallarchaeota archaeon]|nr:polymer-forming cytoskeletal protein [Candidatus Heimdallarchaeota archaeon]MCK5048263.1 polymer-forming cytoskeletal protein [Candidatus Heimdallarchaeota archaeon]